MGALRQKYPNMSDEQIIEMFAPEPGISNKTDENQSDWIYVPGYGRLSWSELEKKVDSGAIIETYDPKTGKYTYTKRK